MIGNLQNFTKSNLIQSWVSGVTVHLKCGIPDYQLSWLSMFLSSCFPYAQLSWFMSLSISWFSWLFRLRRLHNTTMNVSTVNNRHYVALRPETSKFYNIFYFICLKPYFWLPMIQCFSLESYFYVNKFPLWQQLLRKESSLWWKMGSSFYGFYCFCTSYRVHWWFVKVC